MKVRAIIILLCLILAGCNVPASNTSLRGAGLDVNPVRASKSTSNLHAYLQSMCVDAGIINYSATTPAKCPSALKEKQYDVLLQAGFNEISLGCQEYMQFVFEQRHRDTQFKNANLAVQSFINGIFTIEGSPAKLFSYLVLSSTAANAFYDTSNIDPLRGMTIQNISKIIDKRQSALEAEARKRKISSRPQLVRFWREYQWYCTPRSVRNDFNASAQAGIDGTQINFAADAKKVAQTIAELKKFDVRKPLRSTPSNPNPATGAISLVEKELRKEEIENIQTALCLSRDGTFGPQTRAAIDEWRRATSDEELTKEDLNNGLSIADANYLKAAGSCSALGYKTAFERGYLFDDSARQPNATSDSIAASRLSKLQGLIAKVDPNITVTDIAIAGLLRTAIRLKRENLKMPKGDFVDYAFLKKVFSD